MAIVDQGRRDRAGRRLQPRVRRCSRRSRRPRSSRSRARCGRRPGRGCGRPRRAGRGRRDGGRRVHRARQPRGRRASGWTPPTRPATTTGSRPRAWSPGTINEFPWFSFLLGDLHAHVLALPFTLVALAFALQVALAGPRGDAVLRGVAEALAAGLARRRPVRRQLVVVSRSTAGLLAAAVVIVAARPAGARARRAYAISWLVLVLAASVVLVLPFWLTFDPAATRDRARRGARAVRALHARPGAAVRDLRRPAGAPPSPRACSRRGGPRGRSSGALVGGDLRRLAAGRRRPGRRRRAGGAARRRARARALAARSTRPSASCGCW